MKRGESGTAEHILIEKRGNATDSNYFISMNKYGNQELFPGFSDGSSWYSLVSNSDVIGDTEWHHVVYTFDATTDVQKAYVDGVECMVENRLDREVVILMTWFYSTSHQQYAGYQFVKFEPIL